MEIIDNINRLLGDNLKQSIVPGAKLKIPASCFSIVEHLACNRVEEKHTLDIFTQEKPKGDFGNRGGKSTGTAVSICQCADDDLYSPLKKNETSARFYLTRLGASMILVTHRKPMWHMLDARVDGAHTA